MDSPGIAASSLGKVHFRQNSHQINSFMYPGEIVSIPLPPELTQLLNKQKKSKFPQFTSQQGSFTAARKEANKIMQPRTSAMLTQKEAIFWLNPLWKQAPTTIQGNCNFKYFTKPDSPLKPAMVLLHCGDALSIS